MTPPDCRWKQRFDNFNRALACLSEAVALASQRPLSHLEKQGVIQAFEFTHELAWNTLKDFLTERGAGETLYGSRDVSRLAFSLGLLEDGEAWMNMIADRNRSSHTYNQDTADSIFKAILDTYHPAFVRLQQRLRNP
jgi:nucleotidyltransferase substrate binding protein (TIGR01987 family)